MRLRLGGDLRDAEVEHLQHERSVVAHRLGEEEVLGLEVAMNDARVVRGRERVAQLAKELPPELGRWPAEPAHVAREVFAPRRSSMTIHGAPLASSMPAPITCTT